jgi:hypothetical protein
MKNPSELWFQTGLITSTKDYRRYIPIHELCKSLSSVVCEILPAAYALTGCLFRSIWHRFDFPFGSYSLDISFRLRSTELSMSEHSIREKSLNWLGVSYRSFNIDFFPMPKNEEVVSHPVRAKLRVKLATVNDSTLVRFPPSEDTFKQHVLRSS